MKFATNADAEADAGRAGLSTRLIRLQPRAPAAAGAPILGPHDSYGSLTQLGARLVRQSQN